MFVYRQSKITKWIYNREKSSNSLPKRSLVVVIFNENDDLLFVHNRRYTVGHLEWKIPAGKIVAGESIEAAAIREAKVQTEKAILDTDEISSKKWFSKQEYIELLKNNGTKDGVSILAVLFALQFYPFEKNTCRK